MKTIIAGSRSIVDLIHVTEAIGQCGWNISEVVSGGARGPDKLGEIWAEKANIPIKQFIPDWDGLGKCAGFQRNSEMAEYADALIAVWDGKSNGTKDMIQKARKAKLKIFIYKPRPIVTEWP